MKIEDGRISIQINQDGTIIELHDRGSAITFARIRLTPAQLSSALSRLGYTECDMEVFDLEKLGSQMETSTIEFKASKHLKYRPDMNTDELHKMAKQAIIEKYGTGTTWVPDNHYGSQNSFFIKDGVDYARTIIRRWI